MKPSAFWLTTVVVLLWPVGVLACDLSEREFVQFVALAGQRPSPPTMTVEPLSGGTLNCASVGSFMVVRVPEQGFVYVLDRMRVFDLWETTATVPGESVETLLKKHLRSHFQMDAAYQWSRYGRPRLGKNEIEEIPPEREWIWSQVTLPSARDFGRLLRTPTSVEERERVGAALRSRVRDSLVRSGLGGVPIISEKYGEIMRFSSEVLATVTYREGKQTKLAEFRIAVNAEAEPYAGEAVLSMAHWRTPSSPQRGREIRRFRH